MCCRVLLLLLLHSMCLDSGSLHDYAPTGTPQKGKGDVGVIIPSTEANSFLSVSGVHSRVRRSGKWYHTLPDFQAYYQYYNSIGHYEGVLEIDRIRQIYLHMRYLEQVYGKDAPYYQNTVGVMPQTQEGKGETLPSPSCDPQHDKACTQPATSPKDEKGPLRANRRSQCDPHNPKCRRSPFYKGQTHPCNPFKDPSCRQRTRQRDPEMKGPQPPQHKAMEYVCDPIYEANCPDFKKDIPRPPRPQRHRNKTINVPTANHHGLGQWQRRDKTTGNGRQKV